MQYADWAFYKQDYKGTVIPDIEVELFLQQASDSIDQMTFFRISDFPSLTLFQQNQVKKAVCAQAEHLYHVVDLPEGVESFTNGDNSVSFANGKQLYSKQARAYLMPTGLLHRGI